jgi:GNAT superfamily N-acetyltransferase
VPAADFPAPMYDRCGGELNLPSGGPIKASRRNQSFRPAFLAQRGEEVRLLYTRPDRIGMGAGSQLIEASKATGVGALELWCFQANERARRFYEARGFHAVRFTDGADNEEQMPDIRYRWERSTVVTDLPSSPLSGLFQRPSRT